MAALPKTCKQILVHTKGTDFRKVTSIEDVPLPTLEPKHVLVKVKYVGINATDINIIAGRYFVDKEPPYPCGCEALGEIVAVTSESKYKVGQCATFLTIGSFAEYVAVKEEVVVPVPSCEPAFLSIVLSGLTASISLEKKGHLKAGETVLVTGAAGGTGQFAVQLAKQAGCHVVGTCSTPGKADFLRSIGCDRPVNYKKEDLDKVLQKEYPDGVNVVYECIGGDVFDAALNNLATFGRFIVIGQISKYKSQKVSSSELTEPESKRPIGMTLITKSAELSGFFLPHFAEDMPSHVVKLSKLYMEGKIRVVIEDGKEDPNGPFKGLDHVADAIDFMYAGKNVGKLVVEI